MLTERSGDEHNLATVAEGRSWTCSTSRRNAGKRRPRNGGQERGDQGAAAVPGWIQRIGEGIMLEGVLNNIGALLAILISTILILNRR